MAVRPRGRAEPNPPLLRPGSVQTARQKTARAETFCVLLPKFRTAKSANVHGKLGR